MHGMNPAETKIAYANVPLDPTPSTRQGFGRVDLLGSMPINSTGTTVTGPNLQVLGSSPWPSTLRTICPCAGASTMHHAEVCPANLNNIITVTGPSLQVLVLPPCKAWAP